MIKLAETYLHEEEATQSKIEEVILENSQEPDYWCGKNFWCTRAPLIQFGHKVSNGGTQQATQHRSSVAMPE